MNETINAPQHYIVRRGQHIGRVLRELSDEELAQIIAEIPKEDTVAGIKLLRHILDKHGPEQLIGFVVWGQNIINTNGRITKADFTPDPWEKPATKDEKDLLAVAKPRIVDRRAALVGIPSALVTLFTVLRMGVNEARALLKPPAAEEQEDLPPSATALDRLGQGLDKYSSTPIELLGVITLTYEIFDIIKEYEPRKMDQIGSAISEVADNMGIGEPTPTFRLTHARRSTSGRGRGRA